MRGSNKNEHRYIILKEESLGRVEAEARVMSALEAFDISVSKSKLKKTECSIKIQDEAGKEFIVTFNELVQETRQTGVIPKLDRILWRKTDPYGTVALTSEIDTPVEIQTGSIRISKALRGPGYLSNAVFQDILEDIIFYRQEVSQLSCYSNINEKCFRAYRSYLSSCITALDAFLNCRAWFSLNDPSAYKLSLSEDEKEKLSKNIRRPLPVKLTKWIPIFAEKKGERLDENTRYWKAYEEIKDKRNGFIHINEPEFMFSLKDVVPDLNLCQMGVGQFLLEIYKLIGVNPSPNVLKVRYAQQAIFVPK